MRKVIGVLASMAAIVGPAAVDDAGVLPFADGDLAVVLVVDDGLPQVRADRDARIDVGAVSPDRVREGRGRRAVVTIIERRLGVRVTSRSNRRGFVRLLAYLGHPDVRSAVFVDGMALAQAPRLLDAQAPIGSTVGHRVRVEIGAGEPAGAFSSEVVWEIEEP